MLPKLIDFGNFFLPTYGVMIALAFLTALWVTNKLGKEAGLNSELVTNLGIYCALAGLAGAKLLMYAFDFKYFADHPGEIFSRSTLQAAGVFQGGLVLAIIFAIFYMRHNKMPILTTSDAFAPGIAIGHAIGRIGCLAAGCCWGARCDRPWAIVFRNPDAYALVGVPLGVPLHPAQIYEMATEGLLFWLLWSYHHKEHRPGRILAAYLIFSSVARFVIEFFRYHEQALPFGGPLSLTQWISIGILGAGIVLWLRAPIRGEPVVGI